MGEIIDRWLGLLASGSYETELVIIANGRGRGFVIIVIRRGRGRRVIRVISIMLRAERDYGVVGEAYTLAECWCSYIINI